MTQPLAGDAVAGTALEAARRYYEPIARHHNGAFADLRVDEHGPGIPQHHWDAMRAARWFEYASGSYILGNYETWRITDAGRLALTPRSPVMTDATRMTPAMKRALEAVDRIYSVSVRFATRCFSQTLAVLRGVRSRRHDRRSGRVDEGGISMRALTVVDIEEWSVLFDGEDVVNQGHSTEIEDLVRASKGEPFTLQRISAYDSPFDKMVSEAGDVSMATKLADILPLTKRTRTTRPAAKGEG